jgi:predicted phosphodiesterase
MMLAMISDIHGNLEALEAVLMDIDKQKVDTICCLGDVIGYGCDPIPCLELVDKTCLIKLVGNHEYSSLGKVPMDQLNKVARTSATWTTNQLDDRALSIINRFTVDAKLDASYLVHASSYEPTKWHYILSNHEADRAFKHLDGQFCFHGHTHLPMIYAETPKGEHRRQVGHTFQPYEETRYLINIGSVGQPRDNDPRASYITFDSANVEVAFHRVEYDIQRTQAKMQQAELPSLLIERLAVGR